MKKFLIIGNMNAVAHKEIFPLFKDNKIWLGVNNRMDFIQDKNTMNSINSRWFTNLPHNKRHNPITLIQSYSAEIYLKYDNYDAINVDKTKDIPKDYDGIMGVPITFLDKYCPEQFEIIGSIPCDVPNGFKGMSKEFVDLYHSQGGSGHYGVGNYTAHYITNDGKAKISYKRILIRLKK